MPQLGKPVEDRQGHHADAVELDPNAPVLPSPKPPSGISLSLKRSWRALWESPVGQFLDPVTDLITITRLWQLYGLGERLDAMIRQTEPDRFTKLALSSPDPDAEQKVLIAAHLAARQAYNGTVQTRMRVATEVRMLEAQLGLSPRSRLALGLKLLSGKEAAQKAAAAGKHDDADD